MKHEKRKTRIIAIVNRKGGVGKTTTAKNLAYELTKDGKHVLIVDLDPQCNSTKGLCRKKHHKKTVVNMLLKESIKRCTTRTTNGLDMIAGDTMLASLEIKSGILNQQLDEIKQSNTYDYIVMDTSPYFNKLTAEILLSTDLIIIPTQVDIDSLDGMSTTIHEIQTLCEGVKYKILYTQVNDLKSTHNDLDSLYAALQEHSFHTCIRYHRYAVKRARARCQPLSKRYYRSNVAKDYKQLSKELQEVL
ncbi:chromosome partitioning protein [Breznakia sp. PF5-3]|uniref:ParA family protein n=1 Tax=unclassified Breznakia TaxID=2623764 RepID=UPI0024053EB3|nr:MULTISPECIES: AAA family ATPase [unclassified Breznakia]MDF9825194.1 chromosome partitioning protein [Breznakia sp. PM6-1]MDF9836052.1 chromosome partitioning protein [Breznakia sp. PF5-3]MDF9838868.1 chromosome partitioning protein [Breznakia sp. PFB2-8]MDF9860894.1 chromosome partitioning protein [Breznakia sp. PH5-24]